MKYLDVPKEKIRIVNCGISQELYKSKISDSQRRKILDKFKIEGNYLLYVGTLEPRKNIGGLIEAYEKLQRQMSDCPKLVLAGKKGWMYEEIYDKIRSYGLEKQVIMTGYLTEDEKVALMQGAKVFLFPSSYEGFRNSSGRSHGLRYTSSCVRCSIAARSGWRGWTSGFSGKYRGTYRCSKEAADRSKVL